MTGTPPYSTQLAELGLVAPNAGIGTPQKFVCKRGHVYIAGVPFNVFVTNSDPRYNSGPLCPYCYVDWHRENFATTEVTGDEISTGSIDSPNVV